MDGSKTDFLREITGSSICASVGEMSGFHRGDMNKIKDFVSRSVDKFSYKFEGHINQPRQWVTVMDSNRYEGLLRDETGNRRFMPIFCGQLPDVAGKQEWRKDFVCDFALVKEHLWEIFAECRAWFESIGGTQEAWSAYLRPVSKAVFDWSENEAANDRGTIADPDFDVWLVPMLKSLPGKFIWTKKDTGRACIGLHVDAFKRHFIENAPPRIQPKWRNLKNKMLALGAVDHIFSGASRGYLFPNFATVEEFVDKLGLVDYDDGGEVSEA